MSLGFTPVDRRKGTVCHNEKCSYCDPRTRACLLNIEVCSDRRRTTGVVQMSSIKNHQS
jgi:hypothetical protein